MKASYLLTSLLMFFKTTANPLGTTFGALHSKINIIAPDPPLAPAPLPISPDGQMPDGSIINYTPNNPSNQQHSCWTTPLSRPPVSQPIVSGTCSVCVLYRDDNDGSGDYQFWARDDKNNAMGNMGGTTVWPIDGSTAVGQNTQSVTNMGQEPLTLYSMRGTDPAYPTVFLSWAGAEVQFYTTPAANNAGVGCNPAGTSKNGAAIYFICFFVC